VYSIDPSVQLELRSLVLLHLECLNNEPVLSHHDVYDGELNLLPPPLQPADPGDTLGMLEDQRDFCVTNGRRQSLTASWNCLASASMAASRFRFGRALLLCNQSMCLALISFRNLGLPSLFEFQSSQCTPLSEAISFADYINDTPDDVADDDDNDNDNEKSDPNETADAETNRSSLSPATLEARAGRLLRRWRFLSGLNLVLVVLALRILVHVVWIVSYLVLAIAVCQSVGGLLDHPSLGGGDEIPLGGGGEATPRALADIETNERDERESTDNGGNNDDGGNTTTNVSKDAWTVVQRRVCNGIVALYLAKQACSYCCWA